MITLERKFREALELSRLQMHFLFGFLALMCTLGFAQGQSTALKVATSEWKQTDLEQFFFFAPSNWNAAKLEKPNSAAVQSPENDVSVFFSLEHNSYKGLPDIYQTSNIFRAVAASYSCQFKNDPETDGRGMAGTTAIGAYAACQNGKDLRIKLAETPNGKEVLLVVMKYRSSISTKSENYRYGILDSIVFKKSAAGELLPGEYALLGGLGSGGEGGATYMSHGTIEILNGRYRMGDSEAAGIGIDARVKSTEEGHYIVDENDLILFPDAAAVWPARAALNQVPYRIQLQQ